MTWQSSSEALRQAIGVSFQQSAKTNAHQIARVIDNEVVDARIFAEEFRREINEGQIEPGEEFSTSRNGRYYRLILADKEGKVLSARPAKNAPRSLARYPWSRQIANPKNNKVFVGNLHREPGTDKYLIDIAVPMRQNSAARLLVLEATLDGLLHDAAEQRIGEKGHIDIFDSQRNLILDRHRVMRGKMPPELFAELAQAEPTWKVARDEHNRLSLIGVAPITFSKEIKSDLFGNGRQWYLMIPQGLLDAYAPLIKLVIKLLVLGTLAVAIILFIGYYRAEAIVRPLTQLSAGARQIGQGHLDFRVNLTTGDETQDLAEEFNRMAAALQASQQRLRAANDELEQASKLKSEFLANMSHELRTPLNSIIGFAEVLEDRLYGPLNAKQRRQINNIHASGQHLLHLINDILDLSKIEADKVELNYRELAAADILNETCVALKTLADKKELSLTLNVDPDLVTITADEAKFKQIMYNLLSNAVKFTPNKGEITIDAARKRGLAVVSVTDSGMGISKKDQKIIFDQFRQVSGSDAREFEGTGLGLTLTKKLVDLHGGRIRVASESGKGSTFTFTIPISLPERLISSVEATRTCRLPITPEAVKGMAD